MNQAEIIQSQINLLVGVSGELSSQVSPEAAREIRENVKLLVELAGVQEGVRIQGVLEDLETRLETLEDVLFGDYGPEGFDMGNTRTLAQFAQDCREDINDIYERWVPALDRHLGEDWCEDEDEEEAGD